MIRTRIDLDGAWEFAPDPQQQLRPDTLAREATLRSIEVPGPWQAQFDDLRDYSGVAWYRRLFDLAERAAEHPLVPDPTYIVHFGAVDYHTAVWLNGEMIGEHEGGYLPFELSLDGALCTNGPNELVVRVVDPGDNTELADAGLAPKFSFAEIPHGKQSWYGPIGGMWQSVYVEARHQTHITRLHITPDVAGEKAHVNLRLNQPLRRSMGLVLTLTDPRGLVTRHQLCWKTGEQQCATAVPISDQLLWDTMHPHLYHLEATLVECGNADVQLDSVGSHFGMRTIAASADGRLMLNDRILFLRGALDQDYYPELIYTPFSDEQLDEQFAKAKHMGLNCLRTHIKITDPRYYAAADRAGILIWTELPNWQSLTPAAKKRARETLTGMVERDWNHPSIIIWTIVNEGWGVDLAVNPDHRQWLAETYDYLKGLDPHRLVVGNSACFTNFHVVTDIEDFHNYYAIPDHYRQWREWVEAFAARPPWSFAHAYEDIHTWREFTRNPWKPITRPPAPEVRRTGCEPIVVSEFGNWGLPDVEKLRECYGGHDPWWFETGIEWGEGSVYPHGVEMRFKTWHLNRVFPTFADLAAAAQRMQFAALKFEIEQMRRHPEIVGYIITEFTDVHWECNGLLDMCRNPKAFHDVIGYVNSADAIVPDWERVAFWEGEGCEVRLALSHFSSTDLSQCRLEWYLDEFPHINGSFEGMMPHRAQVTNVGTIGFEVPPLKESKRVRLELRLFDQTGELLTRNHQELYFFPRHIAQPGEALLYAPTLAEPLRMRGYRLTDDITAADIAVVEQMTDELRLYVQNGGRVLWLAEDEEAQQTYLSTGGGGTLGIARRDGSKWQGDWASNMNWICQDRMFKHIPTGGTVDFAFADLVPEQVITGLSPRDFATDVHSGLFVGWLHHTVALIAERSIGTGRLLISTYQLREHLADHPVAAVMLHDMVTHLMRPT